VLEKVRFGSQICIISNKPVVHFTSNFCWVRFKTRNFECFLSYRLQCDCYYRTVCPLTCRMFKLARFQIWQERMPHSVAFIHVMSVFFGHSSEHHASPRQQAPGAFSPGIKRLSREADHSPHHRLVPRLRIIYVYFACVGAFYRDNFTFTACLLTLPVNMTCVSITW
jgi:hypothetical protein